MLALGGMGRSGFGRMGLIGSASYNPLAVLSSDLLAWWDADPQYWGPKGSITLGPTRVSLWTDIVAGYNATNGDATEGTRPIYSATVFNGGPGVQFDGVDDVLTLTLSGQFPSDATPSELWLLAQNDAASSARMFLSYGSGNTTSRALGDVGTLARGFVGNTAGTIGVDGVAGSFAGRSVLRLEVGATQSIITIDAVASSPVAVTPTTTTPTRLRLGASPAVAPGNPAQGTIVAAMITNSLSTAKAAALQSWLISRRRP
jgi:hypothetical protein